MKYLTLLIALTLPQLCYAGALTPAQKPTQKAPTQKAEPTQKHVQKAEACDKCHKHGFWARRAARKATRHGHATQ